MHKLPIPIVAFQKKDCHYAHKLPMIHRLCMNAHVIICYDMYVFICIHMNSYVFFV